jgi:hypothetical protein
MAVRNIFSGEQLFSFLNLLEKIQTGLKSQNTPVSRKFIMCFHKTCQDYVYALKENELTSMGINNYLKLDLFKVADK